MDRENNIFFDIGSAFCIFFFNIAYSVVKNNKKNFMCILKQIYFVKNNFLKCMALPAALRAYAAPSSFAAEGSACCIGAKNLYPRQARIRFAKDFIFNLMPYI